MSEHWNCLNCGAELSGKFCTSCGQDAHEGRHPTLGHLAHDLLHEFLHLDGRIGRTLKALVLEPGRLTSEYWEGRIASWVRPLRLFLTAVALNLLIVHHGVGPLNFRVRVDIDAQGNRNVSITPDPDAKAVKAGSRPAPEAESAAYFTKFRKAYTSVRYVSVVLSPRRVGSSTAGANRISSTI